MRTFNIKHLNQNGYDMDAFLDEFNGNGRHPGCQTRHKYKKALPRGLAMQLARTADLDDLLEHEAVELIEEDLVVHADTKNWGGDRSNQRDLPLDGQHEPDSECKGAGTDIFILDTGVQYNHEELVGRTGPGYDAIKDEELDQLTDIDGHGTHCAAIAAQQSKHSKIHGVKVLDDNGSGYTSDIIAGLNWVAFQLLGLKVASLSLGGAGTSLTFKNAIDTVYDEYGVVVTVSAGNSNSDACGFSPAYVPKAITVGATEENDVQAPYTNYGPCVDTFAPGSGILSAIPGNIVGGKDTATGFKSGTSMSCPLVAAVASLLLCSGVSPHDISSTLIASATKDKISNLAESSFNRLLYIGPDDNLEVCNGRSCDLQYDPAGRVCQCDQGCSDRNDCCSDYDSTCDVCDGKCDRPYDIYESFRFCHCDVNCLDRGECCDDYFPVCQPCAANECDPNGCSGLCGQYVPGKPCQCDSLCTSYGDCCSDKECCISSQYDQCSDNECVNDPCVNGGTCYNGNGYYTCVCSEEWTGESCETSVATCAPPCEHGLCVDSTCDCTGTGYSGDQCEIDVDDCANGPCQNGGTCTDGVNGYTCNCAPGFAGDDCEDNDCASEPCQNGGTCVLGTNAPHTCLCEVGFSGDLCEENIDDCAAAPCENDGTCIDGVNGYTCNCIDGWTGNDCDMDVDECACNPCQNDGTCDNGFNEYTCACVAGWTGTNCDVDFNECQSIPCKNGATCINGFNQFTCNCAAGWTGTTCEMNIDECAAAPCENGGECIDGVNGYTCECVTGWTGDTCGEAVPDSIALINAVQSNSLRSSGEASLAIDDSHTTCSRTRRRKNIFWRASFNTSEDVCVDEVHLISLNANDLIGADVYIGSNKCKTIESSDIVASPIVVMCTNGGVTGDYVEIKKSSSVYRFRIELCDVQVVPCTEE